MTAPAESATDQQPISPEDACYYRDYHHQAVVLYRDIRQAAHSAREYQERGDVLHTETISTPNLIDANDVFTSDDPTRSAPVSAGSRTALERMLRDASRQAYVIAGSYRRAHAELAAALRSQLTTANDPACSVLVYDAVGLLGYNRADDGWMAGSEELQDPLAAAAYWLQGAGLLPRFDECFATPTASDEDGCGTCKADGDTIDCPVHGGGIELGTTVTGHAGEAFGTITGVLVADQTINAHGHSAIRLDGVATPYAVDPTTVRPVDGEAR